MDRVNESVPPGATPPSFARLSPIPTFRDHPTSSVADITGVDHRGSPLRVDLTEGSGWTVLLFLTTKCAGCRDIFDAALNGARGGLLGASEELYGRVRVVVVTPDPSEQDPRAVARLVDRDATTHPVTVVMSSAAWRSYSVFGPPFFSLIGGAIPRVVTEGVVVSPEQVCDSVATAIEKVSSWTRS